MWLIAWQHRLATVLLMFGSAATVLSFAGCETAPSKDKPTAAAKSGDKQAGETDAADSGSDDAKETMDEATATEPASRDESTDSDGPALSGDGTDTAATDEQHADPFEVPDGTVEELAKYIRDVQRIEPHDTSPEGLKQFQRKVFRAIVTAVDKIIAQNPGEAEVVESAKFKLNILEMLAELGDEQAPADEAAFLEQLHANASPAVARTLKEHSLTSLLKRWDKLDQDQRSMLLESITSFFAAEPAEPDALYFALTVGRLLESANQTEASAELYTALSEKFGQSSDAELTKLAGKLTGLAHRVRLVGKEFELSGTLLDGSEIDWASYRGKVVLVDFWATWCGPCLRELPNILKNYEKYHDQGFDVIGISLDDEKARVKKLVVQREIPWAIMFSSDAEHQGMESPMAEKYGVLSIPVALLIDREGKLISLEARGEDLGKQLAKLFGGADEANSTEEASQIERTNAGTDSAETKSEASGDEAKSDSETSDPPADGAEK